MKKSVSYSGKNIVYRKTGSGPAIVLLHGFLESKAIWEQFESLLDGFTVFAIDLPGHGESDLFAGVHTMQLMAESVYQVFENENISKAILVGHSMGGYVALHFAESYENRLSGLVLFHSHAQCDSDETKVNRDRTIEIVKKNKGSFILQFIPDLFDQHYVGNYTESIAKLQQEASKMTAESIVAAVAGMRNRDSKLSYLETSSLPIQFIIGKNDSRMPYKMVLSQAELPLHTEVLLLGKVGHMGYIEAQVTTADALKHFATRCFSADNRNAQS